MRRRTARVIAALAMAGAALTACNDARGPVEVTASLQTGEPSKEPAAIPSPGIVPPSPRPATASVPTSSPATPSPARPSPATTPAPATPPSIPLSSTAPSPTAQPTEPEPTAVVANPSAATFIEIESVGIRQPIEPAGLSDAGTLSPPAGTVIWFDGYGRVQPGAIGTAVVAGHVVANGEPDVFHRLPQLRTGDTVRIGHEDGTVEAYRVTHTEVAGKDEVARNRAVWGRNSTSRRLAILTCDDALGFRGDGHRVANFVAIAEPA